MQSDEEVGKVAAPVPVIISRALELFAETLLARAKHVTSQRGARTLTPSHLKFCIQSEARFDFLKDLVSAVPDLHGDMDHVDAAPPSAPSGLGEPMVERQSSSRGRGRGTRGAGRGTARGGTGKRRGRPPKVRDTVIIPGAEPVKTVAEKLFIDDEYDCEGSDSGEDETSEAGVKDNGWSSRLAPATPPVLPHPFARSLSLPHPGPTLAEAALRQQHTLSSPYHVQRSASISNQDFYLHYGAYPPPPGARAAPYSRPILPRPAPPSPYILAPPPLVLVQAKPVTAFYREREEEEDTRPVSPPTNGSFKIVPAGGTEPGAAATELTKLLPSCVAPRAEALDEDYDC